MMGNLTSALVGMSLLADAILKVTLVLIACHALHVVMVSLNPRWRVVMWRAGLVTAILLPPAMLFLPGIQLPVAPAIQESFTIDGVSPEINTVHAPIASEIQAVPVTIIPVSAKTEQSSGFFSRSFLLLWVLGFAFFAVRLLRGHRIVSQMQAASIPAGNDWKRDAMAVSRTLDLSVVPDVRISECTRTPLLCGLQKPAILLPEAFATSTSSDKRLAVLAHEMAHLKSHDLLWYAAFHSFRALAWFHPLLWLAPSLHESTCEEVADAIAADMTGTREMYERALAQVALEAAGSTRVEGAIPMAARAEVCSRLIRLRKTFGSKALRRRSVIVFGCVILAAGGLVGGVRVARAQSEPKSTPEQRTQTDSDSLPEPVPVPTLTPIAVVAEPSDLNFTPDLPLTNTMSLLADANSRGVPHRDREHVVSQIVATIQEAFRQTGSKAVYDAEKGKLVIYADRVDNERAKIIAAQMISQAADKAFWNQKLTITVKGVGFKEATEKITLLSGIQIEFDPADEEHWKKSVRFDFDNTSLREAAEVMATSVGAIVDSGFDGQGRRTVLFRKERSVPSDKSLEEILGEPVHLLDFENERLDQVLKRMADAHALNIVYNPEMIGSNNHFMTGCLVTARLDGITVSQALTTVLDVYGFGWIVENSSIVRIVREEEADQWHEKNARTVGIVHTFAVGSELETGQTLIRVLRVEENDAENERDDDVELLVRYSSGTDHVTIEEFRDEFVAEGRLRIVAESIQPSATPGEGQVKLRILNNSAQRSLAASAGRKESGNDIIEFPFREVTSLEDGWYIVIGENLSWNESDVMLANETEGVPLVCALDPDSPDGLNLLVAAGPYINRTLADTTRKWLKKQGYIALSVSEFAGGKKKD